MPRLITSRPCAINALARASTAKAFSSPMRSKAAMVLSMASLPGTAFAPAAGAASTIAFVVAPDLQLRHPHNLEKDRDRPADQEQPVERRDRSNQAVTADRDGVA